MTGQIDEQATQFEERLRAQAELYRTLLKLARRQAQEISADDVEAFVITLEEKRQIVEEIAQIEQSTDPLRQLWDTRRDEVGKKTRARVRSVVEEIRSLLTELLELESKSQELLGTAKGALEERFRQLNVGPGAVRSYTQTGDSQSRFMDKTG